MTVAPPLPVRTRTAGSITAAAVCLAVFAIAFRLAPDSCKNGWEIYIWVGGAASVTLLAVPFVVPTAHSIAGRAAWAAGFLLAGAVTWVAGLFIANFRIVCSLF